MTIGTVGSELGKSSPTPLPDAPASLLAGAKLIGGGLDTAALRQLLVDMGQKDPDAARALWSQVEPMLTPVQRGEVAGDRTMLA